MSLWDESYLQDGNYKRLKKKKRAFHFVLNHILSTLHSIWLDTDNFVIATYIYIYTYIQIMATLHTPNYYRESHLLRLAFRTCLISVKQYCIVFQTMLLWWFLIVIYSDRTDPHLIHIGASCVKWEINVWVQTFLRDLSSLDSNPVWTQSGNIQMHAEQPPATSEFHYVSAWFYSPCCSCWWQ